MLIYGVGTSGIGGRISGLSDMTGMISGWGDVPG